LVLRFHLNFIITLADYKRFLLSSILLLGVTMKKFSLLTPLLAAVLTLSTPAIAHVGHGDEFQATGGVQKVQVNAATDQTLGIEVKPIEPASDGSSAVMIPVTAVVDADGKQLFFVQYQNFYEPVPVSTGDTKGDLIEVTQGLSVGEKLVTQGSLSLYAESRKTKTASAPEASPNNIPDTSRKTKTASAPEASPNTIPDTSPNTSVVVEKVSEFPIVTMVAIGAGVVLVGGAIAVIANKSKRGY
jgi:membrane fusion protein, cation efflux system